jgi:hypothetical protein
METNHVKIRSLSILGAAILFIWTVCALAGVVVGPTSVTFAWNPQPGLDTNASYNLYGSNNLTVPLSQWPLLSNIPAVTVSGTNSWPTTNLTVVMTPSAFFFYLTASNFWGESGPSNVAGTPVVPNAVSNVSIHR